MELIQKTIIIAGLITSLFDFRPMLLLAQVIAVGAVLAAAGLISLNRFLKSRSFENRRKI